MNELLQQLKALTEVDHSLVEVRDQLVHYPAMLTKMQAEQAKQQKAVAAIEALLEAARHDRRQAEKEIKTLNDQIRRKVSQQADVKTNKEYQAITHEVELMRGKLDEWETLGLEKLDVEESLQTQRKAVADQLAKRVTEHESERQRIEAQIAEKKDRLQRLTGERERRRAALPVEWQEPYEMLNKKFPGTACVALQGENCSGCHWNLVAQTRQHVRQGEEIIRCEHCRRILYPVEVS